MSFQVSPPANPTPIRPLSASAPSECAHCGSPVSDGGRFCCSGCEAVHAILSARGLEGYYALKKAGRSVRPAVPAVFSDASNTWSYLDDPGFRALYATGETGRTMRFFLEGIHCVACVWLLEKLPEFVPGIESVTVDLGESLARVRISEEGSFAKAALEFERIGYHPHPVRSGEAEELQKRENRLALIRIGVAGACAGNIMLLALAIYGGAAGTLAERFNWVSLALFLPVLLFSAVPFYREAWAALRAGRLSIDVPVVVGILLGTATSLVNLLSGSNEVYFDSTSTLVFLLLSSRHVLKRAQQRALDSSKLLHFLAPSVARRVTGETVPVDALSSGELIEVRVGEAVPIDGVVEKGSSTLNCALLTGESEPTRIGIGMPAFAGTVNVEAPIQVRVTATGYSTRLGRVLRDVEDSITRKAPIVDFTNRMAHWFVAAVLVLAAAAFVLGYFSDGWIPGLNRALAMVIITCPCVLALATPLALSLSIGKAARAGILIKGADVLERLSRVDTVVLDKTGTLTTGIFQFLEWQQPEADPSVASAVAALESRSNHPIARAIVKHLLAAGPRTLPEVTGFRERIGTGVEGKVGDSFYQISRDDSAVGGETRVRVLRDGRPVAYAVLGDRLREDSPRAVTQLLKMGLRPRVLSGDRTAAVTGVAVRLGIPPENARGEASPEDKAEEISRIPNALMVGDGANDAAALARAYVGVAVHGGMEVSLRAADAYLSRPGVGPVAALIRIARETMRIMRRNLAFSLIYNIGAIAAALFGRIDPLFAAIAMPVSALIVFLSSIAGTKALRRALEEASS